MEHVKPYLQMYAICFTASGMDQVGASAPSQPAASPLAAAVEASTRLDRPVVEDPVKLDTYPFENGFTCDAINALRARGFCRADAMAKAFPDGEEFAIGKMYADFKKLAAAHRERCAAKGIRRTVAGLDAVMGKAYERNAPLAYFQREIAKICPPSKRVGVNTPECFETAVTGPDHFKRIFDQHFDGLGKRALPLEIGYCADVKSEGASYRGVVKKAGARPGARYDLCQGFDPKNPEDDGTHSVTVIGRRAHQGKCQILIKESSGTLCPSSWTKHWPCTNGKLWIDEDALAANVTGVSRLGRAFSTPPTGR